MTPPRSRCRARRTPSLCRGTTSLPAPRVSITAKNLKGLLPDSPAAAGRKRGGRLVCCCGTRPPPAPRVSNPSRENLQVWVSSSSVVTGATTTCSLCCGKASPPASWMRNHLSCNTLHILDISAAAMVTNVASVAVQHPAAWPANAGSLVSRGAALLSGRVTRYTPVASPVACATWQKSSACRRHRHERGQQP